MSESFKPLDPLAELDRVAFDLDFDLDRDLDRDRDLDQVSPQATRQVRKGRKVRVLPVGIRSISNSPGCAPHAALASGSRDAARETAGRDRPGGEVESGSTGHESGSASIPDKPRMLQPIRRARAVRVDAWAVPASANWTRTHKTARKIRRVSRSTDWALPF